MGLDEDEDLGIIDMDSTTTNSASKKKSDLFMSGIGNLLGLDEQRNDPYDDEREDPAGFTKDFLQRTSLHGLQYIGENNRSLFERSVFKFKVVGK